MTLSVNQPPGNDPPPIPAADVCPDAGLSFSSWRARERAAGRPTKPGPQPQNAGVTPGCQLLVARPDDHLPTTRRDLRRLARRLARVLGRRIDAEATAAGTILGDILDRLEAIERRAGQ